MNKCSIPNILIYAKKIQLLSNSASILQTLNMAWAFRFYDIDVKMFASVNLNKETIINKIVKIYKLNSIKIPYFHFIYSENKGLYGVYFRFFLAKYWISKKNKIFYARDINEAIYLLFLKKIINRNHFLVYEMHDSIYLEYFELKKIKDIKKKKREVRVLNNFNAIVYTGPYLKKIVDDLYRPSVPSIVAPPGFNPNIFKQISEKARNGSCVELAYFGTLFPGKGVDVFLGALAKLPENFSGRVVGGNPVARLDALKEKACQIGLERRINFLGQVPPLDVPSMLEGVNAIVIPFQSESEFLSPIKLYESLALGLPIIATPTPALVRLSKELGSLVLAKGCSDIELSECISDLFSNKERLSLVQSIAQKRMGVQTWAERAGYILDFIRSIM